MNDQNGVPKRSNWTRWLDPRGKSAGSIGFLVNRLAGLGLTLYLFMHLIVLGKLAQGKDAFDGFIALAHNPIIVAGEFIVILAVVLHGFNGLRIALTSFGYRVGDQKMLLIVSLIIAVAASLVFAIRMFGGAG
jgi:succinate dehydrogenase / fumarate reductase cytochrome b subunit